MIKMKYNYIKLTHVVVSILVLHILQNDPYCKDNSASVPNPIKGRNYSPNKTINEGIPDKTNKNHKKIFKILKNNKKTI